MRTIRIVAADDSAVMRGLLSRMFAVEHAGAPPMELCATAPDGASCLHTVRILQPDIVLLDLHMPGLGGLETIDRIRREWPRLPIIMCSAATEDGATATMEALMRGASNYVTKPSGQSDPETAMAWLWTQLAPKIQALARPPRKQSGGSESPSAIRAALHTLSRHPIEAIGIGVSTGGPAALEQLLPALPADFPVPILVVQHMPALFTSALATRLDRCCRLRVKQATAGTAPFPGTIWMAPGDSHMEVKRDPQDVPRLVLHQEERLHHCRLAADVLFRSLAATFGAGALGLVLTGMGSDGLEGAATIVAAGGVVLAQDEASSAVWGMPGRVVGAGLAQIVLPLERLADELIALTSPVSARTTKPSRAAADSREARYDSY